MEIKWIGHMLQTSPKKTFEIITSMKRGKEKDGVLVSHGGANSGYSLYLDEGRIVFACRNNGNLKELHQKV